MNRKMKLISCILLISALALAGCGTGKADSGTDSAASKTSTSSRTSSAAVSSSSSAASKASSASSASSASPAVSSPASSSGSGVGMPTDSSLTSAVVTESNKGEGVNTAPGTVVTLNADAVEGKIGTACPVPASSEAFRLTINKIELTDERNAAAQSADRVVRISYTYSNTGSDTSLLVGMTSFRLLDADGKACQIYYFDTAADSEASAQPALKGASSTAAIGFILPDGSKEATLVYDDQQTQSGTEYYWKAAL